MPSKKTDNTKLAASSSQRLGAQNQNQRKARAAENSRKTLQKITLNRKVKAGGLKILKYVQQSVEESSSAAPQSSSLIPALWYQTRLREKSMTPERKLIKLYQQTAVLTRDLPEDFRVALELFFVHTAGFSPVDRQGRDLLGQGKGEYYRSSSGPPVKTLPKKVLDKDEDINRGETARRINHEYLKLLQAEGGQLHPSLNSVKIAEGGQLGGSKVAIYKSGAGIHSGSLGIFTNAIKTMKGARQVVSGTQPDIQFRKVSEIQRNGMLALTNRITEGATAQSLQGNLQNTNYHDHLLKNRAETVRQTSSWISSQKAAEPIQHTDHASLILHDADFPNASKEKEWRELFTKNFDRAAQDLGYDTRIGHRGSFGFLQPTISSVGGPVRIWPGIVPPRIFQRILRKTMERTYRDVKFQEVADEDAVGDLVHLQTLYAAVVHTQKALEGLESRPEEGKEVYDWLLQRLKNNLQKAEYLLSDTNRNKFNQEQHYLKSSLVIENLTEYTYLLKAITTQNEAGKEDPYPAYLEERLDTVQETETFYLDSGMQAIVSANLLAKKNLDPDDEFDLDVQNINTYFEYPAILRNMGLTAIKPGETREPDIISIDLNPVLTTPGDKAKAKTPEQLRALFETYKDDDDKPIPIIDVTNSSLDVVQSLNLEEYGFENYIIVESLSKHQQLGADKFTMGRLNIVGSEEFVKQGRDMIKSVAAAAHDELWDNYRLGMDQVYYGQKDEKRGKKRDHPDDSLNSSSSSSSSNSVLALPEHQSKRPAVRKPLNAATK